MMAGVRNPGSLDQEELLAMLTGSVKNGVDQPMKARTGRFPFLEGTVAIQQPPGIHTHIQGLLWKTRRPEPFFFPSSPRLTLLFKAESNTKTKGADGIGRREWAWDRIKALLCKRRETRRPPGCWCRILPGKFSEQLSPAAESLMDGPLPR